MFVSRPPPNFPLLFCVTFFVADYSRWWVTSGREWGCLVLGDYLVLGAYFVGFYLPMMALVSLFAMSSRGVRLEWRNPYRV